MEIDYQAIFGSTPFHDENGREIELKYTPLQGSFNKKGLVKQYSGFLDMKKGREDFAKTVTGNKEFFNATQTVVTASGETIQVPFFSPQQADNIQNSYMGFAYSKAVDYGKSNAKDLGDLVQENTAGMGLINFSFNNFTYSGTGEWENKRKEFEGFRSELQELEADREAYATKKLEGLTENQRAFFAPETNLMLDSQANALQIGGATVVGTYGASKFVKANIDASFKHAEEQKRKVDKVVRVARQTTNTEAEAIAQARPKIEGIVKEHQDAVTNAPKVVGKLVHLAYETIPSDEREQILAA